MTTFEICVLAIAGLYLALDALRFFTSGKDYTEADLDESYNEGFEHGEDGAFEDGYAEGLAEGRHDQSVSSFCDGFDRGRECGFEDGMNQVPVALEGHDIDLTRPEFDSPYSSVVRS